MYRGPRSQRTPRLPRRLHYQHVHPPLHSPLHPPRRGHHEAWKRRESGHRRQGGRHEGGKSAQWHPPVTPPQCLQYQQWCLQWCLQCLQGLQYCLAPGVGLRTRWPLLRGRRVSGMRECAPPGEEGGKEGGRREEEEEGRKRKKEEEEGREWDRRMNNRRKKDRRMKDEKHRSTNIVRYLLEYHSITTQAGREGGCDESHLIFFLPHPPPLPS